jgi:molecular chaperone GrpE
MEPKKATAGTGQDDDDLLAKVKAAQAQDSRTVELEKNVAELTEQLKKHSETASRAQAELANAKMRMEKEATEMRMFASEVALKKLLPTIDNLQRALKHLPKDIADNDWVKGIVALEQGFLKQVGDLGLVRFESRGKPLDAERHEVLMQGPGPANTVTEVLEEGYELHGKVIRPAKVKVGDGSK